MGCARTRPKIQIASRGMDIRLARLRATDQMTMEYLGGGRDLSALELDFVYLGRR